MVEDGLPEKMPIIHERSKSACPDGEEGVPEASKPPAMLARRQTPDARLLPPDGEAPLGGKSPSATGSAEVVSTSAATDQPLGPSPRSGTCPAGASPSGGDKPRRKRHVPKSSRLRPPLTSRWGLRRAAAPVPPVPRRRGGKLLSTQPATDLFERSLAIGQVLLLITGNVTVPWEGIVG